MSDWIAMATTTDGGACDEDDEDNDEDEIENYLFYETERPFCR